MILILMACKFEPFVKLGRDFKLPEREKKRETCDCERVVGNEATVKASSSREREREKERVFNK